MTDNDGGMAVTDGIDEELAAMGAVASAVSDLSPEARSRVIGWAADRFGVSLAGAARRRPAGAPTEDSADEDDTPALTEFAELVDRIRPADDAERLLAAAYWEQVISGNDRWGSQEVNAHLKNLGRKVDHVAERFDRPHQPKARARPAAQEDGQFAAGAQGDEALGDGHQGDRGGHRHRIHRAARR